MDFAWVPFGLGAAGLLGLVIAYFTYKKKSKVKPSNKKFAVAAMIACVLMAPQINNYIGTLGENALPGNVNGCIMDIGMVLSAPSGGSLIELDQDHQRVLLTTSDLNSANETNITFTMTVNRRDSCSFNEENFNANINYDFEAYSFRSVDDFTDTATYRTVEYDNAIEKYNTFTVDGISYKAQPAADTTDPSAADTADVVIEVEDYTTLLKALDHVGDTLKVAEVKIPETGQTVIVEFIQVA